MLNKFFSPRWLRWLGRALPTSWAGLALLWLFAPAAGFGLSSEMAISQLAHDVWQRRDGLPSSTILGIQQTKDGYLWLGTPGGLARFDGIHFTSVPTSLTDPTRREFIAALAAAPDGSLWIAARNVGVKRLQGHHLTAVDPSAADTFFRSFSMSRDGKLRAGTPSGVYALQDGKLVALPFSLPNVMDLHEGFSGRLLISTHTGVYVEESGQIQRLPLPEEYQVTQRVFEGSDGSVWVGYFHGLVRLKNGQVTIFNKANGLLGEHVTSLHEDRSGNLWVGTTEGLTRIRPGATEMKAADQMGLKGVLAFAEDREGSLWIGTRDGLHRLKDVSIVPWTTTEGLLGNLTPSVRAHPDGSVFIFSSGDPTGITRFKDGRMTHIRDSYDGPSYIDGAGVLWVTNNGVFFRVDGEKVTRYGAEAGVPSAWISAVTADDESLVLCFSSADSLQRWKDGRLQPFRLRDGTPFKVRNHVTHAHRAKDGSLWMASYDGIWRFRDGEFTRFTTEHGAKSMQPEYTRAAPGKHHTTRTDLGLRENWYSSIAEEEDGSLWFSSQRGGLAYWKDGKFRTVTSQDGLHSDEVFNVLVDHNRDIWMSGPRGISHIVRGELEELWAGKRKTVSCRVYSTEDGMKTEEAMAEYQPAGTRSANGHLWFATKHGVVSINPRAIRRNPLPPPVSIDRIVVDGDRYPAYGDVVLPPGKDKFELHYTALSLLAPERVQFKYQLEGYDKTWVAGTPGRVAHYTKLPPGMYRFRVIACNNDGVWNEEGAALSFRVRPLFHQTGWFVALVLLTAAGSVAGAHFYRVRRLQSRELMLQQRVEERTVQLSQANAELTKEIGERERAQREVERIHQQLLTASHQAGMAEVATGVLHNVGNVLNSVNVSTAVLVEHVKNSRMSGLARVSALFKEHAAELPQFLTQDPKGKRIPHYLEELAIQAGTEHAELLRELEALKQNVDHIRDIVAMQQNYATVAGVVETVDPQDLAEDAIRMNLGALVRHRVELIRDYAPNLPPLSIERHKVLQILVNLIQNAKYACDEASGAAKWIKIQILPSALGVQVVVSDSGVGIPPENLVKIFNHGFTTRKNGHGFGLHSGALAARELGGALTVQSEGLGKGAAFTLDLPLTPPKR